MKSYLVLLLIFALSACSVSPTGKPGISSSPIMPMESTKTGAPTFALTKIATPVPANLPDPGPITSNSPDNHYTVALSLSETPITLAILDNVSRQKKQIVISDQLYNKIEGGSAKEFKWFTGNKVLMFVLSRELSHGGRSDDLSCFFAVDVEQAQVLTTHCAGIYLHLWIPDESGVVKIEHGGLNDVFDYYFPETNCYKLTLDGECQNSNAAVAVEVFANQGWQDSTVTLTQGQQFRIEYVSGRWTYWLGTLAPFDANGYDYVCTAVSCCEPLPRERKGALIGKIGSQVFFIGDGGSFTASAGGMLLLRMNDCDNGLGDNTGSVSVRITR